jgi:hypothetical protein
MKPNYELEICRNAEGSTLAYLGQEGEGIGYRIAGPKGWGGTKRIAKLTVSHHDLVTFIRGYAPEVLEELLPPTPK